MQNNINRPFNNSPQNTLNPPPLHAGSPPVAPLGEVSVGVQQVHAAHNPIPPAVQDLLQLNNPNKRIRSILNLVAMPQQDDYFAGLAQNKSLDDKSRLLAASKIHCPARRDTILSQLEQDSEEQNALLTTARDQSLEANSRLNAAAQLSRGNRREEILAEFAQNRTLNAAVRLEAAKRIDSETLREAILGELSRTLSPNYGFEAVKVMVSSREKNEALLQLARHAKVGLKYRWEMLTMLPEGPQRKEALRTLLDTSKTLEPSEDREAVLVALTAHHSLDIQDRLEAAKALAAGDKRQEVLLGFAQDQSVPAGYRLIAAKALNSGNKNEILRELAQDRSMANHRWHALEVLPVDQFRTDCLRALAHDRNIGGAYRLLAAKALPIGQEQERALEAIARDGSVEKPQRIAAANALVAENLRQELLANIG